MEFIAHLHNSVSLCTSLSDDFAKYSGVFVKGKHQYFEENHNFCVFSGEVYASTTDTSYTNNAEYIYRLIENNNSNQSIQLDGKFVAIISINNILYVLRDFLGIGAHIYYNQQFLSNMLSLFKKISKVPLEPDFQQISVFLKEGYIPAPHTGIKGIKKLQPGEQLCYDHDLYNLKVSNLLQNNSVVNHHISLDDAIEQYSTLHQNAIAKRISGCTNTSVLLSGGYDSGGNLAALRKIYNGPIEGHSVGFMNSQWSEIPLAKISANAFDAKLNVYTMDGTELDQLPKIVNQMGDLFFENGLLLNQKVSGSIQPVQNSCILGGDGNDQLFGTSGREVALLYFSRKMGFNYIQKAFTNISSVNSTLFRANFHNQNILHALHSRHFGFSDSDINHLFQQQVNINNSYTSLPHLSDFDSMYLWRNFNTDIMQSALQVIVHKASRMAELYNLNVQYPYLDIEIYKFLQSLPRNFKLKGSPLEIARGKGSSKYLLKKYLNKTLPEEITNRKKQGGFAPLSIFYAQENTRHKIYRFIKQTLGRITIINSLALNNLLNSVEKTIQQPDSWFWYKQTKFAQLSHLLVLSVWWQQFIEENPKNQLSEYF